MENIQEIIQVARRKNEIKIKGMGDKGRERKRTRDADVIELSGKEIDTIVNENKTLSNE